jgi:hypothetical protein
LFSRNVASVMTRHAQQIAALSSRRWMTGRMELRVPAIFIAWPLYRTLTVIIAMRRHESEPAYSKRLNSPVQKELATSESEKARMMSFLSIFAS